MERMKYSSLFLWLLGFLSCSLAQAGLYPTPQIHQICEGAGSIAQQSIELSGEDIAHLPRIEGAYMLRVHHDGLTIRAYDELGLFYAQQSLRQLVEDSPAEQIAHCTIYDWPDIPRRGIVEGYYGIPWSHEARLAQIEFLARYKMNTYIWAAKDDPYHRGEHCLDPYPEQAAQQIRELCEAAKAKHVDFIWAIHPADTMDWQQDEAGIQAQLAVLYQKLEAMYALGVRHFGVFVDDSQGDIRQVKYQSRLCNEIEAHFIAKHADVAPLLMCPSGYTRLWTPADWLRDLGKSLAPSTQIMWTGNLIIGDITLEGQQWIADKIARPAFIWWNWPCNDYCKRFIAMGKCYGLEQSPEMKDVMAGITSNPMQWPLASRIGLFGLADYSWNMMAYDAERNHRDALKTLYPSCWREMQHFCQHTADMGRSQGGFAREESLRFAQITDREALQQEYQRIRQAGASITTCEGTRELRGEIGEWMQLFARIGELGCTAFESLNASDASLSAQLPALLQAYLNWEDATNSPLRPQVGSVVLTPKTQALAQEAAQRHYLALGGEPKAGIPQMHFSSSIGECQARSELITDRDPDTYWAQEFPQRKGDWYQFDLGAETRITDITLLMGGPRPDDYIATGQWEHSLDGESWQPLARSSGDQVKLQLNEAIQARYLRYSIIECHGTTHWVSICEMAVNASGAHRVSSNVPQWQHASLSIEAGCISLNRIYETATLSWGDEITISHDPAIEVTEMIYDLGDEEMKKDMVIISSQQGAQTYKTTLRYEGDSPADVQLRELKFITPASRARSDARALDDGDLLTAWDASQLHRQSMRMHYHQGCTKALIVTSNLEQLQVNGVPLAPVVHGVYCVRLEADLVLPLFRLSTPDEAEVANEKALIHEIIFVR